MAEFPRLRRGPGTVYRRLKSLELLATRDRRGVGRFLCDPTLRILDGSHRRDMSRMARIRFLAELIRVTNAVRGYHTLDEVLTVAAEILRRAGEPGLTVVECGVGFGASTAKLSLAVQKAGGRLIAFDSFRGMPDNDERHQSLDGRHMVFRKGAFTGRIGSVRRVVNRHGAPRVTTLVKGLFEETLPRFEGSIDVVVLDVDLVASTRTCIQYLFPRLKRGGVLLSTDAHLRGVTALLRNRHFWEDDVGFVQPWAQGIGQTKVVRISKTPQRADHGATG